MRTVVLDPLTASFDEMLERWRRSGLDRLDEVWEGVLHMVPAPSGPHSSVEWQIAHLLSPLAERAGLHHIDEVLIVDPLERSVDWLELDKGECRPIEHSGLIDLGSSALAEQIDWPAGE